MRYGIFSDVHSNLEALKVVIDAYREEDIDEYLCIGDIVGYAANPVECIDRIKRLARITVAGNHDWAVCGLFDLNYFNPAAKQAILWTREKLQQKEKDYLTSLKLTFRHNNFTLVHSTLDHPEEFNYMLDAESVYRTFAASTTQIVFIGHTHRQEIFTKGRKGEVYYARGPAVKVAADNKYIVNVGSVGQPRDRNPRAAYCIFDTKKNEIQVKRISYDIKGAQNKIISANLPQSLADRLALGN